MKTSTHLFFSFSVKFCIAIGFYLLAIEPLFNGFRDISLVHIIAAVISIIIAFIGMKEEQALERENCNQISSVTRELVYSERRLSDFKGRLSTLSKSLSEEKHHNDCLEKYIESELYRYKKQVGSLLEERDKFAAEVRGELSLKSEIARLSSLLRQSSTENNQIERKLYKFQKEQLQDKYLPFNNYICTNSDYKRGTLDEKGFKRKHKNKIARVFNNQCAHCHCDISNGDFHLDHFIRPKSHGGTFLLTMKDSGEKVNNAIPLCPSCNMSKSDKDAEKFFGTSKLLEIFQISQTISKGFNQKSPPEHPFEKYA